MSYVMFYNELSAFVKAMRRPSFDTFTLFSEIIFIYSVKLKVRYEFSFYLLLYQSALCIIRGIGIGKPDGGKCWYATSISKLRLTLLNEQTAAASSVYVFRELI